MHTGDEGIMDEEGYLQGKVLKYKFKCQLLISYGSCWKDQGLYSVRLLVLASFPTFENYQDIIIRGGEVSFPPRHTPS